MKRAKKIEIVALRMQESLVDAIDTLAERQHRSRSDVIRQAALRQLETAGLCPVAIEG